MDPLPLKDRVAARILGWQAEAAPGRRFVHFNGRWTTYGEADRRANRAANALAGIGIKAGDRVAILMRNRLEYLDLWFGLSRLGAIQVPINVDYRSPQIAHTFLRSRIDLVVADVDLAGELEVALAGLGRAVSVLLIDADEEHLRDGASGYEALIEAASDDPPPGSDDVAGSDVGVVMNTSGTTGPSKGVQLTHAQQYILGRTIAVDLKIGPDDVYYNFFPLFHNTAQAMIMIPVMLAGARTVLVDKFSASRFWSDVREFECTTFYYIGEIIRILLKTSTDDEVKGSSLRAGWGIGASADDAAEFMRRFGVDLRCGYGSTEANVPCCLPHGSTKLASAGRVIAGFDVRIADPMGQPVKAGEVGEILVRADEPCAVMAGYDGDPDATIAAWRDLWFHTGDAGRFDEDGDLYFVGRLKDAIRVRGENVSAYEVEMAILEEPSVLEVAAIAVPCEIGGDDVKIVVVLREASDLHPERLIERATSRLPRYAVPRYVEFVRELPKTPTNKIMKHELRSTPFTEATWDRLARP